MSPCRNYRALPASNTGGAVRCLSVNGWEGGLSRLLLHFLCFEAFLLMDLFFIGGMLIEGHEKDSLFD